MAASDARFLKQVLIEQGELDRLRERQLRDYSPEIRSMAKLKDQIDTTLLRKDLGAEAKLNLISSLQQRFDRLRAETNLLQGATPPPAVVATLPPTPGAPAAAAAAPSTAKAKPKASAVRTKRFRVGAAPPPSLAPAAPMEKDEDEGDDDDAQEYEEAGEEPSPRFVEPAELGIADIALAKANALSAKIQADPKTLSRNEKGELVLNGEAVPGSDFNALFVGMFTRGSKLPQKPGLKEFFTGLRQMRILGSEMVSSKYADEYAKYARPTLSEEADNPFSVTTTRSTSSSKSSAQVPKPPPVVESPLRRWARNMGWSTGPPTQGGKGYNSAAKKEKMPPPGARPPVLYVY